MGFVGHRALARPEGAQKAIQHLLEEVLTGYPNTPVIVMAALAPGFDQLAIRATLDFIETGSISDVSERIRIVCPLPLPGELYTRHWNQPDKDQFDLLISNERIESFSLPLSEQARIACEKEKPDDQGIFPIGSRHNRQFAMLGSYISRFSHILVAGWDGKVPEASEPQCGTAFIIKDRLTDIEFSDAYQKTETGVVHEDVLLPPKSRFMNDLEGPVLHLLCDHEADGAQYRWIRSKEVSNDRQQYAKDLMKIPFQPVSGKFLPDHGEGSGKMESDELIQAHDVFQHFEEFNSDVRVLPKEENPLINKIKAYNYAYKFISIGRARFLPGCEVDNVEESALIRLKKSFVAADVLASKKRDRSFSWAIGILVGALLALLVFIFNDRLPDEQKPVWLPSLYVLLVGMTMFIAYLSRKHGAHTKHLDYRFLSEVLRVQLAWKIAGLHSSVFWYIPWRYSISRKWMQWALRGLTVLPPSNPAQALSIARFNYVLKTWIKDQIDYYSKNKINQSATAKDLLDIKVEGLEPKVRKAKVISWLVYVGGLLSVLVAIAPTVQWVLGYFEISPKWMDSYLAFSKNFIVFVVMVVCFWVGISAIRIINGLSWQDELSLYKNMAEYMQALSEKIERWVDGLKRNPSANEYKESIGLALLDLGAESIIEKAQWIEIQLRNHPHRSRPDDFKD
ncbi:MAG: hypothetical protein D6816_18630 [Bacteroidetes bacterium]|nr:MAG: hypothetical protein D6816_18630 [Bacteroidota bacterium]